MAEGLSGFNQNHSGDSLRLITIRPYDGIKTTITIHNGRLWSQEVKSGNVQGMGRLVTGDLSLG
jgi:hypothetical protein